MDRVVIGVNYDDQPIWKRYVGVPLIYVPIISTMPFVIVGILLVRFHLKYIGALNIRSFWSFVPSWISHRYCYHNQITYHTETTRFQLRAFRWYWVFNCKVYCPMSVALFRYATYLVIVVENWWCPFHHDEKCVYEEGAIDQSYWHIHAEEAEKLHPDDRDNPIWNASMEQETTKGKEETGLK